MITLALGELTMTIAGRWKSVTNGTDGMLAFASPAPLPGLVTLDTERATYLYVLTVVAVLVGVMLLVCAHRPARSCAPRGTARPGCGPADIPSPDTSRSPTSPLVASPGRRASCGHRRTVCLTRRRRLRHLRARACSRS